MIVFEPVSLLVSFTLSIALLVVIVGALWWLDRYDREPVSMVVVAYLCGAVLAPLMVAGVESVLDSCFESSSLDWRWLVFGIAPIAIEIPKAIGLFLVLILTRTFDSPTDGFVYGAAVGSGFAVTGPLVMGIGAGLGPGATPPEAGVVGLALWMIGFQVLTSSVLGACLGVGRLSRSWNRRCAWGLIGLAGAVLVHGALSWVGMYFASGPVTGQQWALILLMYLAIVAVVGIILLAEGRVLKRQLSEEIGLGVLPPWTAQVIPSYWRRVRSDWWASRRERTVISRLLTRLAFRKEALISPRASGTDLEGLEIVRLRERIQKIVSPPKNPISPLTEDMW